MVESQPSKLLVAGSIPVSRSSLRSQCEFLPADQCGTRELRLASQIPGVGRLARAGRTGDSGRLVGRSCEAAKADVAQLAERVLGKDEVTGSIPVIGSSLRLAQRREVT